MSHDLKLNLSSEMSARTEVLKRDGQTMTELMEQIYNLGLNQLEYRRKSYPAKKEEMKEMRKIYREAQKNPDLAVALGMATRKEV